MLVVHAGSLATTLTFPHATLPPSPSHACTHNLKRFPPPVSGSASFTRVNAAWWAGIRSRKEVLAHLRPRLPARYPTRLSPPAHATAFPLRINTAWWADIRRRAENEAAADLRAPLPQISHTRPMGRMGPGWPLLREYKSKNRRHHRMKKWRKKWCIPVPRQGETHSRIWFERVHSEAITSDKCLRSQRFFRTSRRRFGACGVRTKETL